MFIGPGSMLCDAAYLGEGGQVEWLQLFPWNLLDAGELGGQGRGWFSNTWLAVWLSTIVLLLGCLVDLRWNDSEVALLKAENTHLLNESFLLYIAHMRLTQSWDSWIWILSYSPWNTRFMNYKHSFHSHFVNRHENKTTGLWAWVCEERFTFRTFRMEAYSAVTGSWGASEGREDWGEPLTGVGGGFPLPLPSKVPFSSPWPFPRLLSWGTQQ